VTGEYTGAVVPDLAEPMLAYREWRVSDAHGSGLVLTSLWNRQPWLSATMAAECFRSVGIPAPGKPPRHRCAAGEVPVYDCTCGLYAYHRPDVDWHVSGPVVTGVVAAYGRVVVGERGLRASQMTVLALAPCAGENRRIPPDWDTVAPTLAARYPTVRCYGDRERMWEAWPPRPVELVEPSDAR